MASYLHAIAALLLLLGVVSTHGRLLETQRRDVLEYSRLPGEVAAMALLTPPRAATRDHPALFTFPIATPLGAVLKAMKLNGCDLVTSSGAVMPAGRAIGDVLLASADVEELSVRCDNGVHWRVAEVDPRDQATPTDEPVQASTNDLREYPFEAIDIMGNTVKGDLAYAEAFARTHWGPLHPFSTYARTGDTGIYSLANGASMPIDRKFNVVEDAAEVRIGLAADWGAGTRESDYVQQLMMKDFAPHYTIHIGDVYYVGTIDEVQSNVLGIAPAGAQKGVMWPKGSLGSFALNGNHEMYARGFGYFDYLLPTLGTYNSTFRKYNGQKASFLALENSYWRIISLDTGYHTYSPVLDNKNNTMPQEHIDWLVNVARVGDPNDRRPMVFLSHHQYRSAWGEGYLPTPKQLAALLPPNRTVLWLWGHEHRLSFYDKDSYGGVPLKCFARCIGVGGFPTTVQKIPPTPLASKLQAYDNRIYEVTNGTFQIPVGFNGFTRMTLTGAELRIDYHSLQLDAAHKVTNQASTLLVTESWQPDPSGNGDIAQKSFKIVDPGMTVVTRFDERGVPLASASLPTH